MSRATLAWRVYAAVAAVLAAVGVWHWAWAVALRGPVLYGEGAVAHASLLARGGLEYASGASIFEGGAVRPIFAAANYPPLYFHLASIVDPWVTGRLISLAAVLFVAGAIVWRARPAGALVSATLAIAWLGSVPVLQWAPALKPDLLALGLTVGAVLAVDRARPRHALAGALLGLAAMAKPTALLPAAALLVFVARREPLAAARALAGGLAAAAAAALLTYGPDTAMRVHVLDWNQLPWRPELAASLALVALIVLAVPVVTTLAARPRASALTAYVLGALGVLLLGGREGATINYFLDLSAALALAVAARAPRLAAGWRYPAAAVVMAIFAVVWLNPFSVLPVARATTGKWGDPGRVAIVRELPGTLLVEDSGLLLALGREPIVDDVFLWSRLREREVSGGASFLEGERVLDAVRQGVFDAVVSEVELERIASVGGYAQQRWHPDLVAAVLARYGGEGLRRTYGLCQATGPCDMLYVYARR